MHRTDPTAPPADTMQFHAPRSWDEALRLRATLPDLLPVAGGTDVMVDLGGGRRPRGLLDLGSLPRSGQWWVERGSGRIRIGAGVTHTRLLSELGRRLPGVAEAVRGIGSPQIRNRGTLGSNLETASPSGDSHPALLAAFAEVGLVSERGRRTVPVGEYLRGPGRTALKLDELIEAVVLRPPTGPHGSAAVTDRRALARSIVSFSVALHPDLAVVGAGVGGLGPVSRPADDAAAFLGGELSAAALWTSRKPLPDGLSAEFARRVALDVPPASGAEHGAYRRHAVTVLARRCVERAWRDHRAAREDAT